MRIRTAAPDPDILVDARSLQSGQPAPETIELLRAGRAAFPGHRLDALTDPAQAELPDATRACFDRVYPNGYAAGTPACFVRLQPGGGDKLFAARLLLRVPSVAVEPVAPDDPLDRAVAAYWLHRSHVVDRAALWPAVARSMRRCAPAGGLAVFTTEPAGALAAALQEAGAEVFGPSLVALLSPRFARTLFIIGNTPADAALLALLRRFGGDAVLTSGCLLAAYRCGRAVAEAELGRTVPDGEMAQWQEGIARPTALLLGEAAAAARDLYVASDWLVAEVASRYGRTARVLPIAAEPLPAPSTGALVVSAVAAGLHAEACVWGLELLRSWGVAARVMLQCPQAERPALAALAARLGVGGQLGFGLAAAAPVVAVLAMRGAGAPEAALAAAICGGRRCVASQSLADTVAVPPWVCTVPDQASPPLLAAALAEALSGVEPSEAAVRTWAAQHAPSGLAARLR